MDKVIFHIDVNSAFLSWEAVYRLRHLGGAKDLRQEIAAVGGDMAKRRGIILAKSLEAKKFGVKTGEPITDAFKKCPQLVIVLHHYNLYQQSSEAFMEILREYSPDVEQYSIDEAFVDMTGMEALLGPPVTAADTIRKRIYDELGFTVNIGVSSNKLLAKMASDFEKPNLVHTLFPNEVEKKMWPLPVEDLFFVGRATAAKLAKLGIRTIGDLAGADLPMLRQHLKKHGEVIWNFANGRDTGVVEASPPENKGYGNSTTIEFDVTDPDTAKMVLLSLSETLAARLRKDHVKAELVSISIKSFRLQSVSHQTVLKAPTNITAEIHSAACNLFDELWDGTPIRHLGVHTGKIQEEECARQLDIFDRMDYERMEKVDQTVDAIRAKFGDDAIMRASFLRKTAVDHMAGGISRERKNVDYSKAEVE